MPPKKSKQAAGAVAASTTGVVNGDAGAVAGSSTSTKRKGPASAYSKPDPGTTSLPAARVQRIIKADRDVEKCSKEAVFVVSVATEWFIRRLTDLAYTQARMDKRKNVMYKDIANACADETIPGTDVPGELFFLSEVIPRTVTWQSAEHKRNKRLEDLGMPYIGSATTKAAKGGHIAVAAQIANQALKDIPERLRDTPISPATAGGDADEEGYEASEGGGAAEPQDDGDVRGEKLAARADQGSSSPYPASHGAAPSGGVESSAKKELPHLQLPAQGSAAQSNGSASPDLSPVSDDDEPMRTD